MYISLYNFVFIKLAFIFANFLKHLLQKFFFKLQLYW